MGSILARPLVWTAAVVAALTTSVVWAACAERPVTAPLRQCIAAEGQALDFSGAVLIDRRSVITTYARGVTAGPGSPPIAVDTRFNLGSSTKMFIAVAVAQLVEAHRVGLDDPIDRYMNGLAPEASQVTIRQLLSHSSGLGDFFKPENRTAILAAHALRDLIPLIATEKPAFAPGTKYLYSNTGYLLLGMLIERTSGQSYIDYLRSHIFTPAHMKATGADPGPVRGRAVGMTAMSEAGQQISGHGRQYRPFSDPPSPKHPLAPARATQDRGIPAGGFFSTVLDMRNFFIALTAGKLVKPETYRELVSPNIVAFAAKGNDPELDYGFGFGVGLFGSHRWFGHAGGLPGANAETNMFPDDRTIIIVLSNRDPPAGTMMYSALRAVLFDSKAANACGSSTRTSRTRTRIGVRADESTPRCCPSSACIWLPRRCHPPRANNA